jgi:Animal haem peroxidase
MAKDGIPRKADQSRRHGTDSYFVVGEGLLPAGADGAVPALSAAERADAEESPPFRFSRMGPHGSVRIDRVTRVKVGNAMTVGGGGAQGIPAGFTYLGQLVDHDLTFDKTEVMLGENISPAELLQARSPSLDLDSLYGAGPDDPESAGFYRADGQQLRMGRTAAIDDIPEMGGFDVPRTDSGAARIPDLRNDENLAVAQTHLAFIRFHNRVLDTLPAGTPEDRRFDRTRVKTIKHYQWMLRHDFLPRICNRSVLTDVFRNGRKRVRARRRPDVGADHADRVLRRRLPPRPQHDPRDLRLEPRVPRRPGHAGPVAHLLRQERRPRRRKPAAEQLDRRLPPALRLRRRGTRGPGHATGPVQPGDAHRHPPHRPARHSAHGLLRRAGCARQGPDRQPRLPQPDPRQDAQPRLRPADGEVDAQIAASPSPR